MCSFSVGDSEIGSDLVNNAEENTKNELDDGATDDSTEINFDFAVNCKMAPYRTLDMRC